MIKELIFNKSRKKKKMELKYYKNEVIENNSINFQIICEIIKVVLNEKFVFINIYIQKNKN